ncbi:MAG: hypothetical protein NZ866_00010 [Patescibacteria group bacterium]|nr:hypothetical protein [Patescibacteria group bacterium]
MENYKNITNNLIWICTISLIVYFIFLPIGSTRPNPQQISPAEENRWQLEANPLLLLENEPDLKKLIPDKNSSPTPEFPKALLPITE